MVQIVDIGDADMVHTDTMASLHNAETAVRAILNAGALPVQRLAAITRSMLLASRRSTLSSPFTSCTSTHISISSISDTVSDTDTETL